MESRFQRLQLKPVGHANFFQEIVKIGGNRKCIVCQPKTGMPANAGGGLIGEYHLL
jgi:hypothetical protein